MAALVAVMIMVSISTLNWDSFLKAAKVPKSDTAVMLLTLALAVLTRNLVALPRFRGHRSRVHRGECTGRDERLLVVDRTQVSDR
jgi:hypothetical protein